MATQRLRRLVIAVLTLASTATLLYTLGRRSTTEAERGSPGRRSGPYRGPVDLEVSGEIWYWRGPAPWYFVTMPADQCRLVAEASPEVSYGWGVIPVTARIGSTVWTTSLFPKDGRYLLPLRADVRRAEGVDEGDTVTVRVTIDV